MGQVNVTSETPSGGGVGTGMILGLILAALVIIAIAYFYGPRIFQPSQSPAVPGASQGPTVTAPAGLPSALPSVRTSP